VASVGEDLDFGGEDGIPAWSAERVNKPRLGRENIRCQDIQLLYNGSIVMRVQLVRRLIFVLVQSLGALILQDNAMPQEVGGMAIEDL
jgi:hypothetical protein